MRRLWFFLLSIIMGYLVHQYWILPSIPVKATTISTVSLAVILGAGLYACFIFFFCLKIKKIY